MFENRTLVMFSGGKDSFLTVCRCIERGDTVSLLTLNNGCLVGEQNVVYSASRLIRRYGRKRVSFEGIYNISAILSQLNAWWQDASYGELAAKLPGVDGIQATCFHCHTAMWTAAIAYAVAKGHRTVCAGYRSADTMCTGSMLFLDGIRQIAKKFDILIEVPLWEDGTVGRDGKDHRDLALAQFGFFPEVITPKCSLERDSTRHIKNLDVTMNKYFHSDLYPVAVKQIPQLREILRAAELYDPELDMGGYVIPSINTGLY